MGFPRRIARGRAGYTLVELMMIVTIIGISVAAFAPGFSRAMADRQVSTVTRELIRLGRRARSDTFGYLRAHLVWLAPTTGRVQLLRAPTNSCLLTIWKPVQADCTATPRGPRCLEDLVLATFTAGGRGIALREERLVGDAVAYAITGRALCYAPSGLTYFGQGADVEAATTVLSDVNTAAIAGGFVYTLHAGNSDPTRTDRVHRVLFPLGASPRALR